MHIAIHTIRMQDMNIYLLTYTHPLRFPDISVEINYSPEITSRQSPDPREGNQINSLYFLTACYEEAICLAAEVAPDFNYYS